MRDGLRRAQKGMPVKSADRPLQDWIQDWLSDVKMGTVRVRTLDLYRNALQHVVNVMGERRINSIAPQDIRRLYADLTRGGMAPSSITSIHRALRTCLADAVKDGLIPDNPAHGVPTPKVERREWVTLSIEQVAAFLLTEQDTMFRALWSLLATTGLRLGEAAALRWSAVDLAAGELRVVSTLVRPPGGGWAIGPPKTAASKRLVYLGDGTVAHLRAWQASQASQPLTSVERFVFLGTTGQPLAAGTVSDRLHDTLYRARLPKLRCHDLRHTAATNLLAMGEQPKIVSEMLGHSSVSITLDLYGHVSPRMHRAAQQRLSELLSGGEIGVLPTKIAYDQA
jgi:integrase